MRRTWAIFALTASIVLTSFVQSCLAVADSGVDGSAPTFAHTTPVPRWPALACKAKGLQCPALVQLGFTYPFQREPGSYLFLDGVVYPYDNVTNNLLGDSSVFLPDGTSITVRQLLAAFGLKEQTFEPQIAVIGYGSNASPEQLIRKFLVEDFPGVPVIPVMKGQIKDYDVVFSPHFVSYGAMPASIVPSPGTDTEVWVNWLDDAELAQMNGSEGAGGLYAFGSLNAELELVGPKPDEFKVYVDCFGAMMVDGEILSLSAVPAEGRSSRPVTEVEALEAVLPTLKFRHSLFNLLLTNVASKKVRDHRTSQIEGLGVKIPDPNFVPEIPCSLSADQPAGGEF